MTKKRYNREDIIQAEDVISSIAEGSRWIKDGITLGAILSSWEDIVGEEFAQNLKPVELKNQKLLVRVPDSVWLNNVQFYREEMIKKINEYLKSEVVTDIKFYIK